MIVFSKENVKSISKHILLNQYIIKLPIGIEELLVVVLMSVNVPITFTIHSSGMKSEKKHKK